MAQGRPKLPRAEKRVSLSVSVTPETKRGLKRAAREAGAQVRPGHIIDQLFRDHTDRLESAAAPARTASDTTTSDPLTRGSDGKNNSDDHDQK